MLFHFLHFSQVCGEYVWAYNDLQSPLHKGDISFKKKSLFKNYYKRLVWTTKLFSSICKWKFGWLAGGEKTWLSAARFKIETQSRCFYITVSNENQLFSDNFGCHFNLNLHIMSDKAAFVSRSLFCALPGKHRALALQQRLPLADH